MTLLLGPLLHYIKEVRLKRDDTEAFFDRHGNPPAHYDIVNWQRDPEGTITHVKVGSYDASAPPGKTLTINASAIQWALEKTQCYADDTQLSFRLSSASAPSSLIPGCLSVIQDWCRRSSEEAQLAGAVLEMAAVMSRMITAERMRSGYGFQGREQAFAETLDVLDTGADDRSWLANRCHPGMLMKIRQVLVNVTLREQSNTKRVLQLGHGLTSLQVPASVCSPSCPFGFRKVTVPGKPICCFDCIACLLEEISNESDSIKCFRCPWDHWSNEQHDKCIPKIKDFLSYKETFGAILAATSIFSSLIPAVILGLFIHYKNTPMVKASNYNLSYLLLLSLTLCFLSSLNFIGYPTAEKCIVRQAAFGLTFALCVSCILAKTIMVVIAFNVTKPNSGMRRCAGPTLSYMVICFCTLVQLLLCLTWLILSPPFSENNTHTQPGMITVQCNEGSSTAFWCMLGYLGFLATISFIVAFLARNLPDSFNETKFITFSMLAFLSVWLSFIPAYLSSTGKYTVAMEIFAILSSSASLLSGIFIPKCYIILFRSEMNTKEYLMGRKAGRSKKVWVPELPVGPSYGLTVDEINNNPTLLPNLTLGFKVYDSGSMLQRSLKGALWILSGQEEQILNYRQRRSLPPGVIIEDSGSTRSILLAHILGLYRYPQVNSHSENIMLAPRG
ncbi:extracellular calcium-sensing receptor-like [Ambystoma mexicanum]|uniref:extracellular calcium-sensing receptor-like n=1 Tax=Ambystoma mexicanum TaxID=8296 RepID=UPI0037E924F1